MKPVLLRIAALAVLGLAVFGAGNLYAPEPMPALAAPKPIAGEPMVRLSVAREAASMEFYLGGEADLEIQHPDGRWQHAVASRGSIRVLPSRDGPGIHLDGREFTRLRVTPRGGAVMGLRWNEKGADRRFDLYSMVDVYRAPAAGSRRPSVPGVLRILTHVPLESYLAGVVTGEMPADWPRDALMSQAIAARTYTAYHLRIREREEYDLGVGAQAWKPTASLPARDAVRATAGVVLLERGNLFPAYYHAECGGNTANVRGYIALTQPVVALSGVRCPRCSGAPGEQPSKWRWAATPEEVAKRLVDRKLLPAGKEIVGLDAYDESVSGGQAPGRLIGKTMGRAAWMRVRLKDGTHFDLRAADFRNAMGTGRDQLSSTWFKLGRDPENRFVFEGRGWGHGVGLCQWGTRYMARGLGKNHFDILQWYYPGVSMASIYAK